MIVIIWVSSTIVQYSTNLTKKVQNYFEVMINYMIAVPLHARRNIVRSLVQVLVNQLFQRQYYSCCYFILDWIFVWVHSLNQTLCTKQSVSDLHLPQLSSCHDVFSTVFICKSRQTTNVSEMGRICSCSTFDRAEQFFIAELCRLSKKFTF